MRDKGWIRGFDGLRAIAVLAVFASHISPEHAQGGWLGVDLFFVLSGYLITSLLAAEHERTGRIALMPFYARRALRLYPALLLMVAACALWAPLFGNRGTATGYILTAVVALTYMSDVAMVVTGTTLGGFLHTWSLSVEEHFYLLWPAAFALALRRATDPLRWATFGAGTSLVLLLATVHDKPNGGASRWFFAPHTRAYELLLGCVLALWLARRSATSPRTGAHSAWAGFAGLLCLAVVITAAPTVTERGVEVVAAGVFAAMLVGGVTCAQTSRLTAALDVAPLRWLGRVSYGVYLYHLPVLTLTEHHFGGSQVLGYLVAGPVTLLLAGASFRYIERPIAARGRAAIGRRLALHGQAEAHPAVTVDIRALGRASDERRR